MASLFAHATVAYTIGQAHFRGKPPARFWSLGILCSIIPDFDVVAFVFGIPYSAFWGHRGFTHSIFFAAILAAMMMFAFYRSKKSVASRVSLASYLFLCTVSHGVLDALTNGGLGVAFFAPFENSRYFFPWRPIQVSPIGIINFLSKWGLQVILSEIIWVGIPCIVLLFLLRTQRQGQRS